MVLVLGCRCDCHQEPLCIITTRRHDFGAFFPDCEKMSLCLRIASAHPITRPCRDTEIDRSAAALANARREKRLLDLGSRVGSSGPYVEVNSQRANCKKPKNKKGCGP